MYSSNSSVAIAYESTSESDNLERLIGAVLSCIKTRTSSACGLHRRLNRRCPIASKLPSSPRRFAFSAVRPCRPIGCCRAWRGDPDVDAWLVPVNPVPPRPLALRAPASNTCAPIVNELTYVPLLVRELARADVVHVFSASYSLVPAGAAAGHAGRARARAAGGAQLPERRGAGSSAAVGDRAADDRAAWTRTSSRRVSWSTSFATFGIDATIIPNIVDLERFRFRERDPLRPRLLSTRNFDALYNVATTHPRVPDRAGPMARRVADAGRRRRAGSGPARAGRRSSGCGTSRSPAA